MAEDNFTLKEIVISIRDDVKEMREDFRAELASLHTEVSALKEHGSFGTSEKLSDHENRIRVIEKLRWQIRGSFTMIAFIMPVLATISWHLWG